MEEKVRTKLIMSTDILVSLQHVPNLNESLKQVVCLNRRGHQSMKFQAKSVINTDIYWSVFTY